MKKAILCAVAALALLAGPASATDFSVFGSYWDTKDADEALGAGAKLRLGRFVELRGTYFSDVTADTEPERFDFEVSAIPIGGGAGYYMLDTTEGDIDDEVGFYAVLGAEFARQPSGLGFMAEAIYRSMEATVTEDEDGFPDDIRDDVVFDLDGLGINAGITWRF